MPTRPEGDRKSESDWNTDQALRRKDPLERCINRCVGAPRRQVASQRAERQLAVSQKWNVERGEDSDAKRCVTKTDATPKEGRQRDRKKFDPDSERERNSSS